MARTLRNARLIWRHGQIRSDVEKGTEVREKGRTVTGMITFVIEEGPHRGKEFDLTLRERHVYIGR